jgi:purine-binding chemotaxis protein CheW
MRVSLTRALESESSDVRDRTFSGDGSQFVRFCVGGQQYALDIMQVKEIIKPLAIAPVPHAPRFVRGIVELRGVFLAVVDLRERFDQPERPVDGDSKYVVVMRADRHLAMIVDQVIDVVRVRLEDVRVVPESSQRVDRRLVAGLMECDGAIVMLLDLEQLFDPSELAALPAQPG